MKTAHSRAVWIDYLRSFITLLVVAHHSALAYATFSRFDSRHYIYSTAPIVDTSRWLVLDRLISFNDLFFMPLMFLISGLFVYRGVQKKGIKAYMTDRFIRLGIPFIVAELFIIPLAYVPSFYVATHSTHLGHFIRDYIFNQQWPVGPPWFIWLLLAFDVVTVLTVRLNLSLISALGKRLATLRQSPARFGIVMSGLAAIALIPLSLWVGQYTWVGNWGPFDFQLNRLLFYFLFFFLGVCLGSIDWQRIFFNQDKLFGKNWTWWLLCSVMGYLLVLFVSTAGANWVKQGTLRPVEGFFLYDLAFVVSCLASVCACLAFFKQKITQPIENWTRLSANAYGIYVVHYVFVTWFQFGLLETSLPVSLKFLLVFIGSVTLSWLSSSLLKRVPLIDRIL